jgi:hypothetical protein
MKPSQSLKHAAQRSQHPLVPADQPRTHLPSCRTCIGRRQSLAIVSYATDERRNGTSLEIDEGKVKPSLAAKPPDRPSPHSTSAMSKAEPVAGSNAVAYSCGPAPPHWISKKGRAGSLIEALNRTDLNHPIKRSADQEPLLNRGNTTPCLRWSRSLSW